MVYRAVGFLIEDGFAYHSIWLQGAYFTYTFILAVSPTTPRPWTEIPKSQLSNLTSLGLGSRVTLVA